MTDTQSWLQVGTDLAGVAISAGAALAAWKAATQSNKSATQSAQAIEQSAQAAKQSAKAAEAMLIIERARRHDELDPSRNGIELSIVTNKGTENIELEISIFSSYAYFLHGEIVLSGGARSVATNKEIVGLHRIGIGNIGSVGDASGTNVIVKGKFVLRFWPKGMECNCGIPQRHLDDSTLPHWKIERGFEYTRGDLLNVYTYGDPGRANMENKIVLLSQH
jgi:hypothetical protein